MKLPTYLNSCFLCVILSYPIYDACNMILLFMFTLHVNTFASDPVTFTGVYLIILAAVSTVLGLFFNKLQGYNPRTLLTSFYAISAAVHMLYIVVLYSGLVDGGLASILSLILLAVLVGSSKLMAAFTGMYFTRHIAIEAAKMFSFPLATLNSVTVIFRCVFIALFTFIAGMIYAASSISQSCFFISLFCSVPLMFTGTWIWYTFGIFEPVPSDKQLSKRLNFADIKSQFSVFMSQPATELLLGAAVLHLTQDGVTAFVQLFLLDNGIDELGISRILSACAALEIIGKVIYPFLRYKFPSAPLIWILFIHSVLGIVTTSYWLAFEIFLTPDMARIYMFICVFFIFEVSLSFYNMAYLETMQRTVPQEDRLAVMGVEHSMTTVLSVVKLLSVTYSPVKFQYIAMFGLSLFARVLFLILVVMFLKKKGSSRVLNYEYEVLTGRKNEKERSMDQDVKRYNDGDSPSDSSQSGYGQPGAPPLDEIKDNEDQSLNKPVTESMGLLRRPYGSLDDN